MYRSVLLLLTLAIIQSVEPHRWCNNQPHGCQRHHHDYKRRHGHGNERFFLQLANDLIEADNKIKTFCADNQETTKEIYEQDIYKLIITVPNLNESTIDVKIKHRVMYIKAERNATKGFVNVKILPDFLNTTAAKWYYCSCNNNLVVAIPYKTTTPAPNGCGDDTNSAVLTVPKSDDDLNDTPQIDVRFMNNIENSTVDENVY